MLCWTTGSGRGTYDSSLANCCPSVIAHCMKSTSALALSMLSILVLRSWYSKRYEKLAIGYELAPGAFRRLTSLHDSPPAGRFIEVIFCVPVALVVPVELLEVVAFVLVPPPLRTAVSTAACVEFSDGSTKFPSIFWMYA